MIFVLNIELLLYFFVNKDGRLFIIEVMKVEVDGNKILWLI